MSEHKSTKISTEEKKQTKNNLSRGNIVGRKMVDLLNISILIK